MKKIFIVNVDCSISEAIKYGIAGHKIIVPEEKDGKPSLELINFSRKEAETIYKEIFNGTNTKARLVFNR